MSCKLRSIRYLLNDLVVTFDDGVEITLSADQYTEYVARFIQAFNAPPEQKETHLTAIGDWLISLQPTPI